MFYFYNFFHMLKNIAVILQNDIFTVRHSSITQPYLQLPPWDGTTGHVNSSQAQQRHSSRHQQIIPKSDSQSRSWSARLDQSESWTAELSQWKGSSARLGDHVRQPVAVIWIFGGGRRLGAGARWRLPETERRPRWDNVAVGVFFRTSSYNIFLLDKGTAKDLTSQINCPDIEYFCREWPGDWRALPPLAGPRLLGPLPRGCPRAPPAVHPRPGHEATLCREGASQGGSAQQRHSHWSIRCVGGSKMWLYSYIELQSLYLNLSQFKLKCFINSIRGRLSCNFKQDCTPWVSIKKL